MEEQFVTYEIAVILNSLSFNMNCIAAFYKDGTIELLTDYKHRPYTLDHPIKDYILAPLWQQVIDWFRDKHKLFIKIGYSEYHNRYNYIITPINTKELLIKKSRQKNIFWCNSYENNREQAILKAIELIKSKNNN